MDDLRKICLLSLLFMDSDNGDWRFFFKEKENIYKTTACSFTHTCTWTEL